MKIIERNGVRVKVTRNWYGEWLLTIGTNIYGGFATRKEAIASIDKYI
jgi:hypothetical protein